MERKTCPGPLALALAGCLLAACATAGRAATLVEKGQPKAVIVLPEKLIQEAKLYRYPSLAEKAIHGETPIDENNHALGALRHLISRLDSRFIAKLRGRAELPEGTEAALKAREQATALEKLEKFRETQRAVFGADPDLWTREDVWS
jgi:hypothetical protein